ncbi:hypothetical protein E2C01_020770 [Portunus trituberculatus]|uniref:Uncharacterized protein n=1 Tax=Portunus trituberculatus TaxID=210409 RepID=A0A5B7E381_PORTR|nr:hypothetical protein [Portunus trituberculatus]
MFCLVWVLLPQGMWGVACPRRVSAETQTVANIVFRSLKLITQQSCGSAGLQALCLGLWTVSDPLAAAAGGDGRATA